MQNIVRAARTMRDATSVSPWLRYTSVLQLSFPSAVVHVRSQRATCTSAILYYTVPMHRRLIIGIITPPSGGLF